MSLFRVLHLSDIHIGKTYKKSEDIAYKVISDIEHNGLCPIRAVTITGDIFDGQVDVTAGLVNEAVTFFDILLKEINNNQPSNNIDKCDFVFVPGNHDLVRTDDEDLRWSKYRDFLVGFYGSIPDCYNTDNFSVFKTYQDEKIVFVGFNSCQLEKKNVFDKKYVNTFKKNMDSNLLLKHGIDKDCLIDIFENEIANEYQDYGNISMAQIAEIERKIKKYDDYNVVALFHHHFYLFPEIAKEFGDTSLIRNYTEVIQHLKYMNVKTVLHGHKHYDLERPFITEDYYNTTESIIDVFSGGSIGTDRKEKHTFNIIDFYDRKEGVKLVQSKFVYNDEMLENVIRKQIPPQNLASRIVKIRELLSSTNPEVYHEYNTCSEKIFKIHTDCNEIINWVSEALTGFKDTYRYLNSDYRNIVFLLYSINYRVLSYKMLIEKDQLYFDSSSSILKQFYSSQLDNAKFTISCDEFHKLFMIKDLKHLANSCDSLLNKSANKSTNIYLAFSMVGIFFADLYLILTKYADDFKESIKYKVNIKIEENKFHENVPAPRIVIKSDSDRRSAYIQLRCNEATAHKMAVLFVKEFDLLINKFEDYFKLIGLKLYYLLPEIDKDNLKDSLDNYNFEAYIPTLLPLLTGDNIYPAKVVFARELIQNSIDAIAVREAKDNNTFSNKIVLELGIDENKKRFFRITDCGTGMDQYKIERYFTSIGRSFYSGDEYEDLQISYKPISNFGIGFLSSFMVCQEIDVKTKYYESNCDGLKLHIPNYDGCFFIEKESSADVGTELKLYLNCDLDDKKIIEYIQRTMLDVKYEISIKTDGKKENIQVDIPAHKIRKLVKNSDFVFFIPLTEKNEVLDIDYNKEVLTGSFVNDYEYGILFCKNSTRGENRNYVLNAGILIEKASVESLFDFDRNYNYRNRYVHSKEGSYNSIYLNFPSNWIQLDVSREKLTGFSEQIIKLEKKKQPVGVEIASALYNQIIKFIEFSKISKSDIPIAFLQEIIHDGLGFCNRYGGSEVHKNLVALRYRMQVRFYPDKVDFEITHRGDTKHSIPIYYENEISKAKRREFIHELHLKDSTRHMLENVSEHPTDFTRETYRYLEEAIYMAGKGIRINEKLMHRLRDLFDGFGFDIRVENNDIFYLFALLLLGTPDEEMEDDMKRMPSLLFFIEAVIMQTLKVSEVATGNNCISVRYDDLSDITRNSYLKERSDRKNR